MRAPCAAALASLSVACLLAARCAMPGSGSSGEVSILSYNVKSLFDARDDGPEFAEFSVSAGRWSEASYRLRLANVAKAVLAAGKDGGPPGPDVACLVEIENGTVLEDLRAGTLALARYGFSAIAPANGGPFANALLSRLPILGLSSHALVAGGAGRPSGRAILEAELDAGGRSLVILVCHWKSRLGGERETEGERREAAALVRSIVGAHLASDPLAEVLVCGDFNEGPEEADRIAGAYPTAFVGLGSAGDEAAAPGAGPARPGAAPDWRSIPRLLVASRAGDARSREGEPVLFSPWNESGGYSYSYRGERSRLDGFLLSPGLADGAGLAYRGFSVVDESFLVSGSGDPIPWSTAASAGFSDHLPILLVLDLLPEGS